MFYGTTPSIVSQYLNREFKKHDYKNGFVPFAGNFVVEQIMQKAHPDRPIHSTDVSIYSNAIGFGSTGKEFKLEMKQDLKDDFKYIAGLDMGPKEKAALIIFMTEVSQIRNKRHIPYYEQLYSDAIANEEMYFEKILKKIEEFSKVMQNTTYYGIDACEVIPNVKKGDLVFYDPPVLHNTFPFSSFENSDP